MVEGKIRSAGVLWRPLAAPAADPDSGARVRGLSALEVEMDLADGGKESIAAEVAWRLIARRPCLLEF